MARTIIVSDLHVDTWDGRRYGKADRRKTKLQHWCDFLDWCEEREVGELIINGDLTDAPPYEGNVSFRRQIERLAIERLVAYASRRKVTYLHGNHDIGISGLRCQRGAGLSVLRNVSLLYPDYVLHTRTSTILIQHGHFFDPWLWAYVRDLKARTYVRSHLQAFQWVQQRRDPETGERVQDPGVDSPARIALGPRADNNVYYAIKLTDAEAPPDPEDVSAARGWVARIRRGVTKAVVPGLKHYIWWEAAEDVFEDYLDQHRDPHPVIYCVMGHTHVPDTGEARIAGKSCIYLNSGTWTGKGEEVEDRQHATYLDVDEDGKIWIQDWIRNPYP